VSAAEPGTCVSRSTLESGTLYFLDDCAYQYVHEGQLMESR
jgi:hypothetical protein